MHPRAARGAVPRRAGCWQQGLKGPRGCVLTFLLIPVCSIPGELQVAWLPAAVFHPGSC